MYFLKKPIVFKCHSKYFQRQTVTTKTKEKISNFQSVTT